jgi:anti-anti-sigma regulatory factor
MSSTTTVLPFPCASSFANRSVLRKDLLNAVRTSRSRVIVDLSGCSSLTHEDIDLLVECVAEAAGRDTLVLFVAGSPANRVLLEVTRISSVASVFDSLEEALGCPQIAAKNGAEDPRSRQSCPSQSQTGWSA